MSIVRNLIFSLIGTGVGVFTIGLYFWIFGSGLPYQDPPMELEIEWMANNLAGNLRMKAGGIITLLGLLCLVLRFIVKRKLARR